MNIWIVTPTYNERDNLHQLLAKLRQVSGVDVLIVDDNSPDGTGQLADQLATEWPRLHVLHRPGKAGLGPAYQAGFAYALERGATAVVQMDADLSHPPELIESLVRALDDHDLAIASRYIRGGRMNIAWLRQMISLVGNAYIRVLLGWGIHDWSTGFKAWRAELLRQLLTTPSRGQGYAWLMEMTWRARQAHARIVEVPLVFTERQAGASKFSLTIALEDLRLAWRLRWSGRPPLS